MASRLTIEKWLKILIFTGLLVLVVIVFSQKIEFTAVDLGRHLENGKIVWSNVQVLFKNFYSYTEPNVRFINHHWLAGVIFYLTYLTGGFRLLSILNILLVLTAFILAFKLAQKKAGFYISSLISIPVIFLLSERVEVRPETFSYLFIILTWFILDKVSEKKNKRLLYWLIPLFFLWANIHIYFFIGLALYVIKILAEVLPVFINTIGDYKARWLAAWQEAKSWLLNLIWIIIACLANPNFISGLLYPFNILKNYGYEIAENKSIFYLGHLMIDGNIPLAKSLLLILALSFLSYFFYFKKFNYFNIFAGAFFSLLALFAIRNISLFGLVFLILFSANLGHSLRFLKNNVCYFQVEWRDKYRFYAAAAILILIIGAGFYLWHDVKTAKLYMRDSFGWGLAHGSEDSIKYFKDNKLSGPIFNNYDLGSALIFWLYPQEKVFVDNRPEAYTNDFFANIYRPMQLERAKWKEYSSFYQFKTIYFSHTDMTPWAQTFLSSALDENWSLVYFDRYTVILLNKTNNDPEKVKNLALDNTAIRQRIRDLATDSDLEEKLKLAAFASLINQPDLAEEIYQELLFSNPDNALVLSLLGNVYAGSQDRSTLLKAKEYLKRGFAGGYKLPSIYNQIGLIDWRLGDYAGAEDDWHQALRLDRKNASALYYLNQIEELKRQGRILLDK